ncbi:MAG: transposase [Methanosarcinales archaeon]
MKAQTINNFVNNTFNFAVNSRWNDKDYTSLILRASSYISYTETVKDSYLPDSDTLHGKIKENSIDDYRKEFRKSIKKKLEKIKKPVIVILDFTHDNFYGKINSNSLWIHEYTTIRGCTGSFEYLCVSIIYQDMRYFVDSLPIPVLRDNEKLIKEVIESLNFLKISMVLIDRGFTRNSRIIQVLRKNDLKYLGLYPKYGNVKKILLSMEGTFLRTSFEVGKVETDLIVIKDDKTDWTFVSNIKNRKIWRYIQLYKKRWNIETAFRVCDEARIKTKSVNIRIRYFYFLITLILYNSWKLSEIPIQFKRYVILCHTVLSAFTITERLDELSL